MVTDITFTLAKVKSLIVHPGQARVHCNKLSFNRLSPHSHKYVWFFLQVSPFNYINCIIGRTNIRVITSSIGKLLCLI